MASEDDLLALADVFDVYADDQRACIAKGWLRGRGIKDAEVRAETWAEAAQELRDFLSRQEVKAKEPTDEH